MGIVVSKSAELAPISVASIIIGFVSFAFTVFTFLRVFWDNITTTFRAKSEIPDMLGNLKQSLYEERNCLRAIRRHLRSPYDEASLDLLYRAVREMLREFKAIERPFILSNADIEEKRSGGASLYGGRAGAHLSGEESDHYLNTNYCDPSIWQRLLWVRQRGSVVGLFESLARIQTRRMARVTVDIRGDTRELMKEVRDLENRVSALEQRLSRVVGVRRVQ